MIKNQFSCRASTDLALQIDQNVNKMCQINCTNVYSSLLHHSFRIYSGYWYAAVGPTIV